MHEFFTLVYSVYKGGIFDIWKNLFQWQGPFNLTLLVRIVLINGAIGCLHKIYVNKNWFDTFSWKIQTLMMLIFREACLIHCIYHL